MSDELSHSSYRPLSILSLRASAAMATSPAVRGWVESLGLHQGASATVTSSEFLPAAVFHATDLLLHALVTLLVGVLAAVFAPLGAALAHRLHQQTLKYVFAAFLVLVGCNMVWKVLASQG